MTQGSDATAYYIQNAFIHGQEDAPISPVVTSGRIPLSPSQVDWTIFWLMNKHRPRSICLDIGCGPLTLLRSLEHLFKQRIGIDIAVQPNWERHPSILTMRGDIDKGPLPFKDNCFDTVTMLMVLEHVFNPFWALREIWRVSKTDAEIILGVPNLASIRHRWRLLLGKLPMTSAWFSFEEDAWDGYHLHNFTQASLSWLLQREGFEPIKWASQGKYQALKRLSPSFFAADLVVLCKKVSPNHSLPTHF